MPVMILLVNKFKVRQATLTCAVQCINLVVQGYVYAWLAIQVSLCAQKDRFVMRRVHRSNRASAQSAYSLWPCAFMHWVWNRVNPSILGSIYTQQQGIVKGEQWVINGEGLIGIIMGFPIVLFVAFVLPN